MAKKKQDQPTEVSIPEDLTALSDSELSELHDTAVSAFQTLYPEDGTAPTDDTLESLAALAEGIEGLKGEISTRDEAAQSRASRARELAGRVTPQAETEQPGESEDGESENGESEDDEVGAENKEPALAASARNRLRERAALARKRAQRPAININLGDLRRDKEPAVTEQSEDPKTRKVALAAQGAAGFDVGTAVSIRDMAAAVNSRLGGFNASSYSLARERGQRQSERFTIAKIRREFDEAATVNTEDPTDAMNFVTSEKNLPQNSLVASGGWCAPSETTYELIDISEAENLVSVPEIKINRGGIRHALGPDYRAVFADTGFCYTEEQDIAGDYDGNGGGTKPCTDVPCPDFEDVRLGYCGVCIGAGLLQRRGYPEAIEDYIGKTLNAHAHRVSASVINAMVGHSEAIVFPGLQAGAVAPLLTAIDLQATHYRAVNRMKDDATLEAILPTWTRAVVRADLSRRLGLAEFDVSDARIAGWFSQRNIAVQYVVDWQDISTTSAGNFTAAPSGVEFLLYAAGTFVKGATDSITMENIYDSVLLGRNDYTALFTEDPYLVAKRLHDSRVVTVPVSPDGATHMGLDIAHNGTVA